MMIFSRWVISYQGSHLLLRNPALTEHLTRHSCTSAGFMVCYLIAVSLTVSGLNSEQGEYSAGKSEEKEAFLKEKSSQI